MAEYKVGPHLPLSQTTQAPGGSIIIMPPTKAVVGFLATLAIAEAAKLNEKSLYHVVEDLPANETVEASDENVVTCFDIMARNGLVFFVDNLHTVVLFLLPWQLFTYLC